MGLMRIARVKIGEQVSLVGIDGPPGQEVVLPISGQTPTGDRVALVDVTLLPPAEPSKIVAAGRNYAEHAAELGSAIAERPRIFLKPPSSLVAHGQAIHYPPESQAVH